MASPPWSVEKARFAVFSAETENPCSLRSRPGFSAGKPCLRKASESTAHVAGFGIHLEGFGPPSLPKRELSVRCGERPHGLSPSRRFPAGMTA